MSDHEHTFYAGVCSMCGAADPNAAPTTIKQVHDWFMQEVQKLHARVDALTARLHQLAAAAPVAPAVNPVQPPAAAAPPKEPATHEAAKEEHSPG